jgi:hypothetical protein
MIKYKGFIAFILLFLLSSFVAQASKNDILLDYNGNITLNVISGGANDGVLSIKVKNQDNIVYLNTITISEAKDGFFTFRIPNLLPSDVLTVELSGAIVNNYSLSFDENTLLQMFNKSDISKINVLLKQLKDKISSGYQKEYDGLSAIDRAEVDNAVINGTFETFAQLKGVLDEKIKSILDRNKVTASQRKSNGGGGESRTSSASSIESVRPTVEIKEQEEKSAVFTDLDDALWAKDSILELAKRKFVTGTGEEKFYPNKNVTRAEFVKIITEAFGLADINANSNFTDVATSDWYYPYVSAVSKGGIVKGISKYEFGPNYEISRQEVVTILYRLIKLANIKIQINNENVIFSDFDDIDEYAKDAVKAMSNTSIIKGIADGIFAPNQKCTRAMAAKVIYSVLEVQDEKNK